MSWWEVQTRDDAPALREGTLHLWFIDLTRAQACYPADLLCLSARERARAARFIPDGPRHQYVHARARTRAILGRYMDIAPAQVQFHTEHRGKPRLAPEHPLRFNLSHSNDAAALVVGTSGNLGVDIEHHDPLRSLDSLTRYAFAQGEREVMKDAHDPGALFFRTWTRKEAYLKAMGQGLAIDLKSFEVDAHAASPARLKRADHAGAQPNRWWVHGIEVGAMYSLALAYDLEAPQQIVMLDATTLG